MVNKVKLNLERLKIFASVYETKSILLAAKLQSVTSSAASQAIKKLEDEVGTVLFERHQKKMSPRPSATQLYEIVAPYFSLLVEYEAKMKNSERLLAGLVRMGAPIQFGQSRVIELLSVFRQRFPEVEFELALAMPDVLFEKMKNGDLDLSIVDAASTYAKLFPCTILKSVYEDQSIVGSTEYFEREHGGLPSWKQALSKGTFITHLEKDADIKFWFKHHFNFIPREMHVALRVPNILAVKHAVLHGMGMGMMSLRLVAEELESGKLKALIGKKKPYQNEMAIVVPATKHENLIVTKFAEFLRDEI